MISTHQDELPLRSLDLSSDLLRTGCPVDERLTLVRLLVAAREASGYCGVPQFEVNCPGDRRTEIVRVALTQPEELDGYTSSELGTVLLAVIRHYPENILDAHFRREAGRAFKTGGNRRLVRGGRGYEANVKLGMGLQTCEIWNAIMEHFAQLSEHSVEVLEHVSEGLTLALTPHPDVRIGTDPDMEPRTALQCVRWGDRALTPTEAIDLVDRVTASKPTDSCLHLVEGLLLAPDRMVLEALLRNRRGGQGSPDAVQSSGLLVDVANAIVKTVCSLPGGAGIRTLLEAVVDTEIADVGQRIDVLFRNDSLRSKILTSALLRQPSSKRWLRRVLGPPLETLIRAPPNTFEVDDTTAETKNGGKRRTHVRRASAEKNLLALLDAVIECLEFAFAGRGPQSPRSVRAVCSLVKERTDKAFPGLGDQALVTVFVVRGIAAGMITPYSSGLLRGPGVLRPDQQRALVYLCNLMKSTCLSVPLKHPLDHLQTKVAERSERLRGILEMTTKITDHELLEHPSDSEPSQSDGEVPGTGRSSESASSDSEDGASPPVDVGREPVVRGRKRALTVIRQYIAFRYDDLSASLQRLEKEGWTADQRNGAGRGRTRTLIEAVLAARVRHAAERAGDDNAVKPYPALSI